MATTSHNQSMPSKAIAAAIKEQVSQDSWHNFLQYFRFGEVCKLAELFYEKVYFENDPAAIRGCDAKRVVENWLQDRWNPPNVIIPRSKRLKLKPEQVFKVKMNGNYPADSEDMNWQFRDVVRFTYHLQALHLAAVPSAGFNQDDIDKFKDTFQRYDTGKGLFARRLFDALGDLEFTFPTLLEQNVVVDLVKKVDVDKSGTIDFTEFLHMLRILYDRRDVGTRKRQHSLIIRSGMTFQECQDWLDIFELCENESGADMGDGIAMGNVKDLFDKINLTWTYADNAILTGWLQECDEDCNGQIDFGEFCCLVQRMWDTNFANIKEKTASSMEQARKQHRRPSFVDPGTTVPSTWTAQMMADVERQVLSMCTLAHTSQELIHDLEAVLKEAEPESDSDPDN